MVKEYYPAIIKEKLFYRTQQSRRSRRTSGGGTLGHVSNLFTSILFDGVGPPYSLRLRDGKKYLVTEASRLGPTRNVMSIPYSIFETVILRWIRELRLELDQAEDNLEGLKAEKADIEERVRKPQAAIRKTKNLESLIENIAELQTS